MNRGDGLTKLPAHKWCRMDSYENTKGAPGTPQMRMKPSQQQSNYPPLRHETSVVHATHVNYFILGHSTNLEPLSFEPAPQAPETMDWPGTNSKQSSYMQTNRNFNFAKDMMPYHNKSFQWGSNICPEPSCFELDWYGDYPTLAREFQGFRVWGKFVFRTLELTDTPTYLANQVKVGHALDQSRSVQSRGPERAHQNNEPSWRSSRTDRRLPRQFWDY